MKNKYENFRKHVAQTVEPLIEPFGIKDMETLFFIHGLRAWTCLTFEEVAKSTGKSVKEVKRNVNRCNKFLHTNYKFATAYFDCIDIATDTEMI